MPYSVENIRQKLFDNADEKYRKFSEKLLPETKNILGVRLPILRKIAKEIYKNNGTKYLENECKYFEEIMLQGMLSGLINDDIQIVKTAIKNFIPKIDNWSVCDSFCCGLKFIKGKEDEFIEFIKPFLLSNKEFEVRFGAVILLNYYITEKYIDTVLNLIGKINHDGHYAKMAAAWAISICYVKFPEKTYDFLKNSGINKWIFDKSIQKITESLKVTPEMKTQIKQLKLLKQF